MLKRIREFPQTARAQLALMVGFLVFLLVGGMADVATRFAFAQQRNATERLVRLETRQDGIVEKQGQLEGAMSALSKKVDEGFLAVNTKVDGGFTEMKLLIARGQTMWDTLKNFSVVGMAALAALAQGLSIRAQLRNDPKKEVDS